MDKLASVIRSVWLGRALLLVVGVMPLLWVPISNGQTTSITSSGLNTKVSHGAGQPNYDITGGTRPGNGQNLFHSFGNFNVPNNHVANFLNDSGLATLNILGRVTGGNPSTIFGTIQTTGFGEANLFLMNPAGIVFGPHASLNVGGSVTFTTADYLKLADGVRFKAMPNLSADGLLSAAPVAAFGFLGSHPGAITIQGSQLSVPDGKSLTLVGGDVRMTDGALKAPSGQVLLASLAGRGKVVLNPATGQPGLTVTPHARMGAITLASTVADPPPLIDTSGSPGGAVVIRGGQLVLNRATVNAGTTPEGDRRGAGISIAATDSVTMNHSLLSTQVPRGEHPSLAGAGSISMSAPLMVLRGSAVDASTSSIGPAGDIVINGRTIDMSLGRVMLEHSQIVSTSEFGTGGTINIRTHDFSLSDGATISVSGVSAGRGGAISIEAAKSIRADNGSIAADGFDAGGYVNLHAGKSIQIRNGSRISSDAVQGGLAGHILIQAGKSLVSGDSEITAESGGLGFGIGGTIDVGGREVTLSDSRLDTSAAPGSVSLGGRITIDAKNVTLRNSFITSLGGHHGGTVAMEAKNVTLTDSALSTGVAFGDAPDSVGGLISVEAKNVTLRNSRILSIAEVGTGGTITIRTDALHKDARSVIDASSQFGTNGTVTIDSRH